MKLQDLSLAVLRELRQGGDARMFQSASGGPAEEGEKARFRFIFCCADRAGWAIRAFVELVPVVADLKSFCWHMPPNYNNARFLAEESDLILSANLDRHR